MAAPTSRSTISRISRSCSWAERPSALRSVTDGLELLVQARDADHEELVEVRVEDREELHPLEERPASESSASSRTRRLNASQEISRLK